MLDLNDWRMANNTPPLPPGGTSIASYSEPITNALITGGATFGTVYAISPDSVRGSYGPLIAAIAAILGQLLSQTLISPAITNTFQLQTKAERPPEVVNVEPNTTNNPGYNGRRQGNNMSNGRYLTHPLYYPPFSTHPVNLSHLHPYYEPEQDKYSENNFDDSNNNSRNHKKHHKKRKSKRHNRSKKLYR